MSTPQTVKAQIQSLIDQANATTGNEDTDLTSAVGALVSGFGQGGSGEDESVLTYKHLGSIYYLFCRFTFPETIKEVVIDVEEPLYNYLAYAFKDSKGCEKVTVKVKNLDPNIVYDCSSMLMNSEIVELDLTGIEGENGIYISVLNYAFSNASKLKIIKGNLNTSKIQNIWAYNNAFVCSNSQLEEIRFVENGIGAGGISFKYCKKLSDASIQSITDGLVDLTGQTAQNIEFSKTFEVKLTNEQKATITNKNWNLLFTS